MYYYIIVTKKGGAGMSKKDSVGNFSKGVAWAISDGKWSDSEKEKDSECADSTLDS